MERLATLAPFALATAALLVLRRRAASTLSAGRTLCLRHGLSIARGFLAEASASPLPPKFAAWESVATQLALLNRTGRLHAAVHGLPTLSVDERELDEPALRRARVLLTCLAHSYVHGGRVPWAQLSEASASSAAEGSPAPSAPALPALPAQLAVPWRQVSARLELPLVLTATEADLWNCELDPAGCTPIQAVACFRQLFTMTGTPSERGFHAVPHAMQLALAPLTPALASAPALVARGDVRGMAELCAALSAALKRVREVLERIYDEVGVREFYNVYRPLLGGWGDGLRLPASSEHGQAATTAVCVGPSAGQSSIFFLVDLALGVSHGPKLAGFQAEMRSYVPGAHRRLLEEVEDGLRAAGGSLRTAAEAAGAGSELAAAHAAALDGLAKVRAYHMGVAVHYLKAALRGTGGSDFRSMLQEGVRSTRASTVS